MKSMSFGMPHSTRSVSSFLVRVGRSTTTPGRLTFFLSLQQYLGSLERCRLSRQSCGCKTR